MEFSPKVFSAPSLKKPRLTKQDLKKLRQISDILISTNLNSFVLYPTCKNKMKNIYISPNLQKLTGTFHIWRMETGQFERIFFTSSSAVSCRCHIPDVCCWPAAGLGNLSTSIAKNGETSEIFKEDPKNNTPPQTPRKNKWKLETFLGYGVCRFLFLNRFHSNL